MPSHPDDLKPLSDEDLMRAIASRVLPDEPEAVREVNRLGSIYGYGNLIAHLNRAWAIHLLHQWGVPYESGVLGEPGGNLPAEFTAFDTGMNP